MSTTATTTPRTIVMTGVSRGFGRLAAVEILRGDADVHLGILARSGGDALAEQLAQESGNAQVRAYAADLDSVASVRAAIAAIAGDLDAGRLPALSGFVGNAGLQLTSAARATADGVEETFAVNVLANHVLIAGLRDRFVAPARLVITTSDTHFGDFKHNLGMVPAPQWREPRLLATPGEGPEAESTDAGRTAYSTSKLAVVHQVHAWARRLPAGVEIVSFNPGLVPGTGLVRDAGPVTRFAFRRIMPAMTVTPWARRASVSAADLAALALGQTAAQTGDYVNGRHPERSSEESYDAIREAALMIELERLAAGGGVSPTAA
jgi:NAD(P)-dependent dehydrogenase (short-subunit alcohol dehydrogenase family)